MIDQTIDISGLSKAEILAALYNAGSPAGLGFVQAGLSPKEMTAAEAEKILAEGTYFDYLKGRSLKINLSGDTLDPYLYDRDNGGKGTAERIIEQLRATGSVVSEESREIRERITERNAYMSPVYARLGELIADARARWTEILADGIDSPPHSMTPRQHLDWSSEQALVYHDRGEPENAIILFLALVGANPQTAWIATHTEMPIFMQIAVVGTREEMEKIFKGFIA